MSASPPVAGRREHVREHHGDRFVDHYEWLRDRDSPEVIAYLEAENAYADVITAPLAPVRESIVGEIKARVQQTDLSVPVRSGPWWYYSRTVTGESYGIQARCPALPGQPRPLLDALSSIPDEQIILDGNEAARGHEYFAVGAMAISQDHGRSAIGVDTAGDERFDVTIRAIESGEVLDSHPRQIGYGVEFSRDGRHLFYTRLDDAWRPFQVWRHVIGEDPGEDLLVYHESDERFWVGVGGTRDDRWIVISSSSRTTSEVRILDAANPTGTFTVVAPRTDGIEYDVEVADDHLLITHNRDNPNFDLARAPLDASAMEQWEPVLQAGEGQRLLGAEAYAQFTVVSLRDEGLPTLGVLERDPDASCGYRPLRALAPGLAGGSLGVGDNPEVDVSAVQVIHESWTTPRAVVEVDVATGELTVLKRQPVLAGFNVGDYRERREWVPSADGTLVPVSIVHHRDVAADGSAACLLVAYGAYEISSDPYFSAARLSLLDRGVVYAVAHARGGGELGRSWYEAGRFASKHNTFDDVEAAARWLISTGWSSPRRLGLEGGSAGGLMVGAVTNQAPELFAVVHAQVPFVDALTTILRPDLPLTVGEWDEWGNPLQDREIYAAMKAYTPYENIAVAAYPAILATTSMNDTRVYFTEPAKWVAALRATVTNDPATAPIVLRTEMVAGHGGRSGRYAAWEQLAWEWAFVLDQLQATALLPGAGPDVDALDAPLEAPE